MSFDDFYNEFDTIQEELNELLCNVYEDKFKNA